MPYHHAIRVSQSYADISGNIQIWADRCKRVLVVEHEKDDEVATTHVHIALFDCEVQAEALKRMFLNPGSGNKFWSFKKWSDKPHPHLASTPYSYYLVYMFKSNLRESYSKEYSTAEIEEFRLAWQSWASTLPLAPEDAVLRQTNLIDKQPKSKLTKHGIVSEVVNLVLSEYPALTAEQRKAKLQDLTETQIYKLIRKVLIRENQALGLYKQIDLYDAFVMYHQKEKGLSEFLHILNKRSR